MRPSSEPRVRLASGACRPRQAGSRRCSGLSLVGWAASGWRRAAGPRWLGSAAALAVFAVVAWHPFPAQIEQGKLELTAIDVGQGEALLLGLPDGTAALVDAGGAARFGEAVSTFDVGEEVVSPYLWSRSIRRLRALAVTHPDADHLGGAEAILRNFDVEELWLGRGTFDEEYADLIALARERGVPVVRLGAGDVRELGEVSFRVLSPGMELDLNRNDLSLAMVARYGAHEVLLAGDLEEIGESLAAQGLSAIDGEVLKVSHHGSRTSSTRELLGRFRPEVAVVSAGPDNLYGHPHAETLERLRGAGAMVLRTDRRGAVTVLTDGQRIEVR